MMEAVKPKKPLKSGRSVSHKITRSQKLTPQKNVQGTDAKVVHNYSLSGNRSTGENASIKVSLP